MMFRTFLLAVSFLAVVFMSACSSSRNLVSVVPDDSDGTVELIYSGRVADDRLVKEIRYYPNGDTLSVTPMKKRKVHGVLKHYHPGNILEKTAVFGDGRQEGLFRQFDEKGVLLFEGTMKNGMKHGLWVTWYDETQREEERTYIEDRPHGTWRYWYIDGYLKREEEYENGELVKGIDH